MHACLVNLPRVFKRCAAVDPQGGMMCMSLRPKSAAILKSGLRFGGGKRARHACGPPARGACLKANEKVKKCAVSLSRQDVFVLSPADGHHRSFETHAYADFNRLRP